MKKISIVIPTRNRSNLLKICIESLVNQNYDKNDYEIIVVDDGSDTDENKIITESFRKKFKHIKYAKQIQSGPATARNLGIKLSSADIVAFIDDDCTADKSWIKSIKNAFSRNKDAWAIEGKTLTVGEIGPFSHYIINTNGGMFVTCNMAFRKSALKSVGGFDERFKHADREDSDVAFSIIERDGNIIFAPSTVVYHTHLRSSFMRQLRRKTYYMWDILLAKKHPKLYKSLIKYPFERFTPFYIIFSVLSLLNPYFLIAIPIAAYTEIIYRNYACNISDYLRFIILQVLGSFLVVFSIIYGLYKFR